MAGRLTRSLSLAACLLLGTAAQAQLADPTRPAVAEGGMGGAGGAGGDGQGTTATAPVANAGLQSVILRKKGKPAALINGELVELGGKVGEARLVKVSEDAVVLKGPAGKETLLLTPAAAKRTGKPEASR